MKTNTAQTQENLSMTGLDNNGEQPASAIKTRFTVELVESGTRRHVEIIKIVGSHESKIIVGMKHMNRFIQEIESLLPYAKNSEVYRQGFVTDDCIKYKFELYNEGKDSSLVITCFKNKNEYQILLTLDVLQSFLDGCKNFAKNYPEIDLRHIITEKRSRYSRDKGNYRWNGSNMRNEFSNMSQQTERPQHKMPLKAVDEVIPRILESGEKSFIFEVIKGDKEFLRVTERIRDNIKGVVHIPLNDAMSFAKAIEEITSEHDVLSKKTYVE
ncbi:hypothetical protein RF11_08404 [Thelohanellus kitauei]|uniref:Uncharacterized protein n=1 Tax=Thelohanellus kitauei TaxID=669202 RepID=A0A0C2MFH2_THEKT|nr:hypothetical protein RF11_08404 [Thelohanellus kitauei]